MAHMAQHSIQELVVNLDHVLDELARLLEVPRSELSPEAKLPNFGNWDSLTKVSLIGFVQDRYQLALNGAALEDLATVAELTGLVTQSGRAS
jgi:acyl carrier protein